jgi:hypothetical protein
VSIEIRSPNKIELLFFIEISLGPIEPLVSGSLIPVSMNSVLTRPEHTSLAKPANLFLKSANLGKTMANSSKLEPYR